MPQLKLSYFDMHGGRGETARLALSIGRVPFEDNRIPFAEWPNHKNSMPFGAIPVLEVDGYPLSQSETINRYVGKLTNLYPSDPWQAAICDEIMDALEDMTARIVSTFNMSEDAKKATREAIVADPLPRFLKRFEQCLEAQGGKYFADNRLTVADLTMFVWLKMLTSDQLDYIPTDLPNRISPKLSEHFERINNDPGVKAYYAQRL